MGGRGGKRGKRPAGYLPGLGLGTAAGLAAGLITAAFGALAVARLGWAWCLSEWFVLLAGAVSCFIGGTVCGRLSPGRKLPMALACGLLWLGLWLLAGWLSSGQVDPDLMTKSLAAAFVGAATAGVFAVNRKNNGK